MATCSSLRKAAQIRGFRLSQRGSTYLIFDGDSQVVHAGSLDSAAAFLAAQPKSDPTDWQAKPAPGSWEQPINDYLATLSARGRREATLSVRQDQLQRMARGLGCPPAEVTRAALLDWFGNQTHWTPATRSSYRSAARRFFSWAHETGRLPMDLGDAFGPPGLGRPRKLAPPQWAPAIKDYLHTIAAAGHRDATRELYRSLLENMARGLGCPPEDVTAEALIHWFGSQTHWSIEHRRKNRSVAKQFFTWAYKTGRVPLYLGDELPKVRQGQAMPRPAPDDAWEAALATADARATLMLRLAAEAGLRRGEVAQVHTRDVMAASGSAQLVVHGKGGRQRIVPISTELAALVRRGAAGHTPGNPDVRVAVSERRRAHQPATGRHRDLPSHARGVFHAHAAAPVR